MPNLLENSAAWMAGQLQSHTGRTVSLSQGTVLLSELVATMAMHEHKVPDADGFLTLVRLHDWTFKAADLLADGRALTVRNGAVIETASGERYEALPLGDRPCVEPLDAQGVMVTVHTKRIGSRDA